MAHCPLELLDDLAEVFAEVRTWAGIVEKKPGVFYVRGQPFLHFHLLAESRRCADIKVRTNWLRLDLPRPTSRASRRAFLTKLHQRYNAARTQ